MGFFSDLKEDLSQAVNELMPQGQQAKPETEEKETGRAEAAAQSAENAGPGMYGAVSREPDVMAQQSADPAERLWTVEELPEDANEEARAAGAEDTEAEAAGAAEEQTVTGSAWGWKEPEAETTGSEQVWKEPEAETTGAGQVWKEPEAETAEAKAEWGQRASEETPTASEAVSEEAGLKTAEEQDMERMLSQMFDGNPAAEPQEEKEEDSKGAEEAMEMNERVVLDETSVITAGMVVTGDLNTEGSVDVAGTVNGNIDVFGKLNITGYVNGNSKAAEIYAENAKINGQIVSEGAVKIESSTVIIGNITATSAAIAGAVKGDIDVKGPVILDASAIVMGNIKSKSVQINNGAVIEGMCSQCYADVNPVTFFDDYKPEVQTKSKSR